MSPQYCIMCRARTTNTLRTVPKCPEKRKLWTDATGITFHGQSKVCDKHFSEDDFYTSNTNKRKRLLPGKVPKKPQKFTEHMTSASGSNMLDFSSQTEKEIVESGVALDNLRLRLRVAELERENSRLKRQLQEWDTLKASLDSIFTETQVRLLLSGKKQCKWKTEDISYAMCLHGAGPRAYRHLKNKGFPLPNERTLQSWSENIDVKPGCPIEFALDLMKNAIDIAEEDKLCALLIDEMKVAKPHSYVHVVMVHGLRKSWKQPIYFDYDKPMTIEIVHELINQLYTIGYHVLAMVLDKRGPKKYQLWKDLEISPDKTWFEHPSDADMKVFVFAHVPHLLKLLRNHFIDSGLIVGGKILTAQTIKEAMSHAAALDLSIAWKVTEEHLAVRTAKSQQVKLATQLLSNSTASAIRECYSQGLDIYNACETADFIQLINDWFDIYNSDVKMSAFNTMTTLPTKQPFGWNLEMQRKVLYVMTKLMSLPIVANANKCLPFQKRIVISNTSLDALHMYLTEKYQMDYVITSRLLLDPLKLFFLGMRGKGGFLPIPTPLEFKFKLRKYLLANINENTNDEEKEAAPTVASKITNTSQNPQQQQQQNNTSDISDEEEEEEHDEDDLDEPYLQPVESLCEKVVAMAKEEPESESEPEPDPDPDDYRLHVVHT